MAGVEWIKINTDMFDNRKIKYLRRLPEGNNIVLIWVMLLTMAGRCNSNGMIFLTENIPYTPEILADELNFEVNTVRLALEALKKLNMIELDDDMFFIPGWTDHQNVQGLEKIKEQNRVRKQKQREREKLAIEDKRHVTSRDSHATEEEGEREKKENRVDKSGYTEPLATPPQTNLKNSLAQDEIDSLLSLGYPLALIKEQMERASQYNGWLTFERVRQLCEEHKNDGKKSHGTKFNNFKERSYDYSSLERSLHEKMLGG